MKTKDHKETRFYIDIDLTTKKVINMNYNSRAQILIELKQLGANTHRVFLTKGQYNKLEKNIKMA